MHCAYWIMAVPVVRMSPIAIMHRRPCSVQKRGPYNALQPNPSISEIDERIMLKSLYCIKSERFP